MTIGIRKFDTGATRDTDEGKLDYEGFLCPLVIERYAEYLHRHRVQADGGLRDSDNWQHGIPRTVYMKSMWRHFKDVWTLHRGYRIKGMFIQEALCALLFNVMGYLHEELKAQKKREDEESANVILSEEARNLSVAMAAKFAESLAEEMQDGY